MKKTLLPRQPALLLLFLLFTIASGAQDFALKTTLQPAEARNMAATGLPNVLQWVNPEDLPDYGLMPGDDFSKITIGSPFYLATVDEVLRVRDGAAPAVEIKTMMLPLLLGGTVRCFIYLSREDGQWKPTGIGGKVYADKNMDLFNKTGTTPSVIVQVHQANEAFLMVKNNRTVTYQPLFRTGLDAARTAYSLDELFVIYHEALRNAR